jgi:glycine C-acetyltransferase
MSQRFLEHVGQQLESIRSQGLFKDERVMSSMQRGKVQVTTQQKTKTAINLCANNYLGLADHPEIREAAKATINDRGFGVASVRFICGTQDIHKQLERATADLVGMDDAILYSSCFDANGGLFETLLGEEDAVISDQLNHASIIDGVRLCKAKRYRYANCDMNDLREKLKQADAEGARFKLITTDGVFSMDGHIAPLDKICDLADEFGAIVHFDDCHATGFLGATGRGTHEFRGVLGRIDLTTGTFGKALGGSAGGYTAGKQPVIDLLRQRSRPYLFSNALPPAVVGGTLKALEIVQSNEGQQRRKQLWENTTLFREQMTAAGFDLVAGQHAIVPVMFYDAKRAAEFSKGLAEQGVFAVAFSFPVVPQGKARIRTQMSAALSSDDVSEAVRVFAGVRRAKMSD